MALKDIHEKNLLQAVINAVPAPVFYKDQDGRYLGGNHAFEQYIGLTLAELVGNTVHELFDQELADVYKAADDALLAEGGAQVYEAKVKFADGSLRDVEFHKAVFHADLEGISGVVGVILDVTERNLAKYQFQQLAFTDSLTGLSNRLAFQHDVEHALLRADRTDSVIALMLLDLDNFKQVNDTHGHPVGDGFLVQAANRLQEAVRKSDVVARLGGDEFAILIEDVESLSDIQHVADSVLQTLSGGVDCCGNQLTISTSIGIALNSASVNSIEVLMKQADAALYEAKRAGKNRVRWFNEGKDVADWVNQPLI